MLGSGEEKQMLNSRAWQIEPVNVLGVALTPADNRDKPGMSMVNQLSISTRSQVK